MPQPPSFRETSLSLSASDGQPVNHNDYSSTMYPLRTFPPSLTILAPSFLLLK